MNKCSKCISII